MQSDDMPICERNMARMFAITGLPLIRHKRLVTRIVLPLFSNLLIGGAIFSVLFYPEYYLQQGAVWTADMCLMLAIYNYIMYLQTDWDKTACFEHIDIAQWMNVVSISFYYLYMCYWLYFAVIQFMLHSRPSASIQLGNVLMSSAWYIFFSTISALYYYICIRLLQRAATVHAWLKSLKHTRPTLDLFYTEYSLHHKKMKRFNKYWNFIILLGFILLTFHVPIDLIAIVYRQFYYDIPGFIIKLASLGWYIYCICALNNYDIYIIAYLYKHRIFTVDEICEIDKYITYRPIGMKFYGISINGPFVIKILLIIFNLLLPTLYALLSNNIIHFTHLGI